MVDLKGNPFYLDDEGVKWVQDTIAGMTSSTTEEISESTTVTLLVLVSWIPEPEVLSSATASPVWEPTVTLLLEESCAVPSWTA